MTTAVPADPGTTKSGANPTKGSAASEMKGSGMTNIVIGSRPGDKPSIHGRTLAQLPLAERLRWLTAISAGKANLLSLTLAQLPRAFDANPAELREARRVAGHIVKSQHRKYAAPIPAPTSEPANVDLADALRRIGASGFLKIAEMIKRDELARAAAAAKANGAALNGGVPHHT
jgi:hypothetical protein